MAEEIVVPRSIRDTPPDMIQETRLGYSRGSVRQYRYGRLHIREYEDAFVVHTDTADPRRDPLGHLVYDAPEILAGMACGSLAGAYAARAVRNLTGSQGAALAAGLAVGAAGAGLAAVLAKRLGERLG